jgi:hypothetical protein
MAMQRLRLIFFATALMLLGTPNTGQAQLRNCSAARADKAQDLRKLAATYIADSSYDRFRQNFGIVPGDTSSLSIVTADSVCEAITAAVDTLDVPTHSSSALIVVHFQHLFFACYPDGYSVMPVYVLDESYLVKTVIEVPS